MEYLLNLDLTTKRFMVQSMDQYIDEESKKWGSLFAPTFLLGRR
ncbi:hypothetical protein [Chengkuizengella marina]|nr:hypothetical protein [Chengkuizengella marina]